MNNRAAAQNGPPDFGRFGTLVPNVGLKASCQTVDSDRTCKFEIDIYGAISAETVRKVRNALTFRPLGWRLGVNLYSDGGDIDAAMLLGRIFREAQAQMWVNYKCVSACVLVFSGGVVRNDNNSQLSTLAIGKIGIHRPALAGVPNQLNMKYIQRSIDEVILRLRAYAKEMNISERLIEDMLVIPPEKVRWLSHDDLHNYGLTSMDPTFAELQVLKMAKKYGITPSESRTRRKVADSTCWKTDDEVVGWFIPEPSDCVDKVLSGNR